MLSNHPSNLCYLCSNTTITNRDPPIRGRGNGNLNRRSPRRAVDPTFASLSRYGTPPQSPPNQRSVRRKASITESHPWPLQRALHQSAVSSPLLVRLQLRDRRRPTASASSVHSPGLGSIFNGDDRPSPGLLLGSSANMALSWVLMMRKAG